MNREQECERLTAILNNCPFDRGSLMADFLISNGIIVPPVNIGDKIYVINEYKMFRRNIEERHKDKYILPASVIAIVIREEKIRLLVGGILEDNDGFTFEYTYGVNAFQTKEEAQQAIEVM